MTEPDFDQIANDLVFSQEQDLVGRIAEQLRLVWRSRGPQYTPNANVQAPPNVPVLLGIEGGKHRSGTLRHQSTDPSMRENCRICGKAHDTYELSR